MDLLKDWTINEELLRLDSVSEEMQIELLEAVRSHTVLKTLLASSYDLIFVKDIDHKFIYASDALAILAGYNTGQELVGKSDFDIFPFEHASKYFDAETPVLKDGKPLLQHEEPYLDQQGKLCWSSTNKHPVYNAAGKIVGLIGISRDITVVQNLAIRDDLTNLLNRRALFDFGRKAIAHAERNQNIATVFFIDLDKFKTVNDEFGHKTGDQVLQLVAERLNSISRESDYLCRFGGDEFVMLLTLEEHDLEHLVNLAKRMLSIFQHSELYGCGCSIGIVHTSSVYDLDQLIVAADRAMYRAKKDPDSSFSIKEL